MLWCCWLGGRNGIRPVKNMEWWGACVAICLERGANDLHMVQLMPLSPHHLLLQQNPECFILLVPAYPGCPGKSPLNDYVRVFVILVTVSNMGWRNTEVIVCSLSAACICSDRSRYKCIAAGYYQYRSEWFLTGSVLHTAIIVSAKKIWIFENPRWRTPFNSV